MDIKLFCFAAMAVSSIKAVRVNAVTNVETDTAFVEVEELLDRSVRYFHILGMKHLEHHLNGQAYIHCTRLQLRVSLLLPCIMF